MVYFIAVIAGALGVALFGVLLERGFFGAENLKEMITVWELPYDPPE